MEDIKKKADPFRKYENLSLSFDQALELTTEEDFKGYQDTGEYMRLLELVGREESENIMRGLMEDNARRICLVSIYGAEKFVEAALNVTKRVTVPYPGAMLLVEEELSK